jgi:Tfp pilus assembly protein PilO
MNSENILIAVLVVIVIVIVCLSYFFYSRYTKQQDKIEHLIKQYEDIQSNFLNSSLTDTVKSELNNVYKRNTQEDCVECELEPFK